ncbi:hypothetical protein ACS0TY_010980 [Phlomoides rotata]
MEGRQGERVKLDAHFFVPLTVFFYLYVWGAILGYKRSKSNQYPNTSLVQIEEVNTQEEVAPWEENGLHLQSQG